MQGKLLLRTPGPLPGEGILGYVLRVAEVNGYDSPWHVFRHAGVAQGGMLSAGLPVYGLALILGKEEALLAERAYIGLASDGKPEYRLYGRSIGRGLNLAPLRLSRPAICPACVKSNGCTDVCWDASAFVACPVHGSRLLQTCPSCRAPLSWFRPGLLRCNCGASLAEAPTEVASAATLDLMALLREKLLGNGVVAIEGRQSGIPAEHLTRMPLESLLRLLALLQGLDSPTDVPRRDVAEVFATWPLGFYEFLRRVATNAGDVVTESVGMRKQFSKFYQSLFKSPLPLIEVEFIRAEFVRFGQNEWGEALVDKKLLRAEPVDQRFVSGRALASLAGVMPVTVRRWIDQGAVPAKTVEAGRAKRFVADSAVVDQTPRDATDRLGARQAGKLCNLPVSVLQELKRTGHYATNPIANCRTGYWPLDLTALSDRLMSKAEFPHDPAKDGLVELDRILAFWKLGGIQSKGAFLAAVLDGKIVPAGITGKEVRGLLFRASDVELFRVGYALDPGRKSISAVGSARILGIPVNVVVALVAAGHLHSDDCRNTYVMRASIEEFRRSWRALSALASELQAAATSPQSNERDHDTAASGRPSGPSREAPLPKAAVAQALRTTSGAAGPAHLTAEASLQPHPPQMSNARELRSTTSELRRICDSSSINTLAIAAPSGRSSVFVDESSVSELKAAWHLQRSTTRKSASQRLSDYLAHLSLHGHSLPRKGVAPNKSAIALACGFDRERLASNSQAGKLLESFASEEAEKLNLPQRLSPGDALTAYIKNLTASGSNLPRRGGQPNKLAIARACGFKRDLFYSNPSLRQILDR